MAWVPHLRRSFIALRLDIYNYGLLLQFTAFCGPTTINRMTQGLKRYQFAGDLHFVTFSCYRLEPYLDSASARCLFEETLERMRLRYKFCVIGYVVMPEHVHLLVSEPVVGPLAKALHAFKLSMSKRSVQRPFWQARYYDFNVFTQRKHVEKLRYIHRNPVKRGLVERPEDWQWSSFRHYATGVRGSVEIESFWTEALREKTGVRLTAIKGNKKL
jgi:putative transposase